MSPRQFKNFTTYSFVFRNGTSLTVENVDDTIVTATDENQIQVMDQKTGLVYDVMKGALNAVVRKTEVVELDS